MTLKEAQEVLERVKWKVARAYEFRDDIEVCSFSYLQEALEAARVVERASVFKEGELKKLKDLRDICTQDDLLDLDSYDSIERSIKISNAWEALKVLDRILSDNQDSNV